VEWTGTVAFVPEALEIPLKTKKPTTWFLNSMSDLFHESVTFEQLDQIFAVMALTPQHTYQCLTKRPERMLDYFKEKEFWSGSHLSGRGQWASEMADFACEKLRGFFWVEDEDGLSNDHVYDLLMSATGSGYLPSVWLGVTVENQQAADERQAPLKALANKGWFTWVSHEPALEQVDFTGWEFIRWLVMGGESGPGARPFDIEWPRHVMKWAADNQVDFFLKQLGSKPKLLVNECYLPAMEWLDYGVTGKGNDMVEWPADLRVRQMPSVEVKP
jgi:protein gp37